MKKITENADYSIAGTYTGVLVRVPKINGLEHKPAEEVELPDGTVITINEHQHSAVRVAGVWIHRRFEGILPSEDAGLERIFDMTIEKKVLGDGRWYIALVLKKSTRKTADWKLKFQPYEQDDSVQLSSSATAWLQMEKVQTYYCTCSKCGTRIQMTHRPNPKYAGANYIGPCCLPRQPRQKKSTAQRRRESGLQELQDLYNNDLYNNM